VIYDGKYTFRRGRAGDRSANYWADQNDIPTFVLEYEGRQIGAAHGIDCYIILIQSFDKDKGLT